MSEILGPDGQPVRPASIAVPPGQAVDLKVTAATTFVFDGTQIILEPGTWRVIPGHVWEMLVIEKAQLLTERAQYRAALGLPEGESPGPVSRQVRRRALRDLRN